MTVEEMITALQQMPPKAVVMEQNWTGAWEPVIEVHLSDDGTVAII